MGRLNAHAVAAAHSVVCGTWTPMSGDGCVGCGAANADAYLTSGCAGCSVAGEAFCWACVDRAAISADELTVFPGRERKG
ncbi:hypothetical protein GCM10011608_10220 [Micromonospora sonchi]|uniref:Uncharacterized protein n=1 Tax=Micromonospora sonchi TaxID=1763543 RepID=A0A917WSD3_9ACTN|nr:hypothetical protein GCM10011608_10220 [Micromonospora sonchi]